MVVNGAGVSNKAKQYIPINFKQYIPINFKPLEILQKQA